MNNIQQRLFDLITREFDRNKATELNLDLTLRKDLGLDSLSMTELVIACEEEFEIEIDLDHPATAHATTIRPLYDAIVSLCGSAESATK